MKNQLLQDLSLLHEKVAAVKVYDRENVTLLAQYEREFEALITRLLTFDADEFEGIASAYNKTSTSGDETTDLHDDTDNADGFYASVANLNGNINDAIENLNGL